LGAHRIHHLFSIVADWIGGIVGAITIVGVATKGAKAIMEKRKAESDRRQEEDKRRKERDEFIDKLPSTIDTLTMAVAQFGKIAETVSRLEDNQVEAKELRRIQAAQDKTAYYRCAADGRCYEVSQPLCELFGLTEKEMLSNDGAGWVSVIEHPSEAWQNWVVSVSNNLPYEDEYTLINRDVRPYGRTLVRTRAWPVRGVDGKVLSFYGIVNRVESIE
jgi:PAS domain-containing protein